MPTDKEIFSQTVIRALRAGTKQARREAVQAWNAYVQGQREQNPNYRPDLRGVDLSQEEEGLSARPTGIRTFKGLDLSGAQLEGADLSGIYLKDSDFSNASFKGTKFDVGNVTIPYARVDANKWGYKGEKFDQYIAYTMEGALMASGMDLETAKIYIAQNGGASGIIDMYDDFFIQTHYSAEFNCAVTSGILSQTLHIDADPRFSTSRPVQGDFRGYSKGMSVGVKVPFSETSPYFVDASADLKWARSSPDTTLDNIDRLWTFHAVPSVLLGRHFPVGDKTRLSLSAGAALNINEIYSDPVSWFDGQFFPSPHFMGVAKAEIQGKILGAHITGQVPFSSQHTVNADNATIHGPALGGRVYGRVMNGQHKLDVFIEAQKGFSATTTQRENPDVKAKITNNYVGVGIKFGADF